MKLLKTILPLLALFCLVNKADAQTLPMIIQYNHPQPKPSNANNAAASKKAGAKNILDTLQNVKGALAFRRKQLNSDTMRMSSESTTTARLDSEINLILNYNTHRFLTKDRYPKPFSVFRLNRYNLDSVNNYIYNQSTFSGLQSTTLQSINGSANITAEFASALFGPVRVGLSGTFQTTGDTTKDAAIKSSLQKIVANGGTININGLIPIFISRNQHDKDHFEIFGQNNIGLTPGIDTTGATDYSKNLSFTDQVGILIHADAGSNNGGALLSLSLPCFYSISSNNLNKQLGTSNYFSTRVQIGVSFSNVVNLQVSGTPVTTSSKVRNTPWLISLQFSPAQIVKSASGK